jgi:hypothetical protein
MAGWRGRVARMVGSYGGAGAWRACQCATVGSKPTFLLLPRIRMALITHSIGYNR